MLTNSDLKEIKNTVDNTVEPLSKDIKGVKLDITGVKKDIKDVKKGVRRIDKTLSLAIKMLNEDDVRLQKRVAKIENHFQIPQALRFGKISVSADERKCKPLEPHFACELLDRIWRINRKSFKVSVYLLN